MVDKSMLPKCVSAALLERAFVAAARLAREAAPLRIGGRRVAPPGGIHRFASSHDAACCGRKARSTVPSVLCLRRSTPRRALSSLVGLMASPWRASRFGGDSSRSFSFSSCTMRRRGKPRRSVLEGGVPRHSWRSGAASGSVPVSCVPPFSLRKIRVLRVHPWLFCLFCSDGCAGPAGSGCAQHCAGCSDRRE